MLSTARLQGSMGRVACAGDNAAMESFWAPLQRNVLNNRSWTVRNCQQPLSDVEEVVLSHLAKVLTIEVVGT